MLFRLQTIFFCIIVLTAMSFVHADELVLKDGRVVQGKVIRENKKTGTVLFRTQSGAARAEFELKLANIKKINYTDLPENFWDQSATPVKTNKQTEYTGEGTPFLECPITGVFGKDVFVVGIEKTLRYAISKGVKEIVFTVDTEGQWNVDEVRKIIAVLKKYDDKLFYNVLIKKALGEGLVFAVFADNIYFAPGAVVGGIDIDNNDQELLALNQRIARKAYEAMQAKGQSGRLIRAMIDPQEVLSGWKDPETGKIQIGIEVPEGTPKKDVVFECKAGDVLVLKPEMLKAAHVHFISQASEIGKMKEISPWVAQSQVGFTIMKNTRERMASQLEKQTAKTNKKVTAAISRRDSLIEEYEHYMDQAQKWDPSKQEYATRGRRYTSNRGLGSIITRRYDFNDNYVDSQTLTTDSRKRWQEHTNKTIQYLKKAGNALRALRSAESRVEKLGFNRKYTDKEIKIAMEDTATKIRYLHVMKDRKKK